MDTAERKKYFLEIGKGAMTERFDYELNRVVDNILDPNTPATKARKVTITLTLKPDADRGFATYETVAKSTLQPTNPIVGSVSIRRRNGVNALVEMVPEIPGQMVVGGGEQRMPDVIELRKQA